MGEDVESVQNDRVHLQASLRITQTPSYALHELHTASGGDIREYVGPSGKVFGVAWHGPFHPDLEQLLGIHFEEYRQALLARGSVRGPIVIQLSGLVVHLSGHMRDLVGHAYLPDQIPAGVRSEDIR